MPAKLPGSGNGSALYYGLKSLQQEYLLRQLLAGMDLRWKKINQSELTCSLASLVAQDTAAIPDELAASMEEPESSILLLDQLSDEQINTLLTKIRQTKGLHIDSKAVVTKHNRYWTFLELAAELKREQVYMRRFMALRALVGKGEEILATDKPDEILQGLLEQAKQLLAAAQSGEEIDQDRFMSTGRELSERLQQLEQAEDTIT